MVSSRDPRWDILRGIAVLGILPVNIWFFGWPLGAIYQPDMALRASPIDAAAWSIVSLLLEHKMVVLLAFIMGYGLGNMHQSRVGSTALHRRLAVLAALGLAHGYLIWWGDILWLLAVASLLTWQFRHLPARQLIRLGVLCLLLPSIIITLWSLASPLTFTMAFAPLDTEQIEHAMLAYQGQFEVQFQHRWPVTLWLQTLGLVSYGVWPLLGAQLIGFALHRYGGLQRLQPLRSIALISTALGLLISACVLWLQWQASGFRMGFSAILLPIAGGLQAAGYVLLFGHCAASWGARTQHRLNATFGSVGRLSLSVYLLQSLILSGLFYGHGWGLMGQLSLGQLLIVALCLCSALTALAWIWERYFGMGPLERLWRTLSYR